MPTYRYLRTGDVIGHCTEPAKVQREFGRMKRLLLIWLAVNCLTGNARGGRALPQSAFLHRGIGEARCPAGQKASPLPEWDAGRTLLLHGQCRHRLFRPDHAAPQPLFRRQPECHMPRCAATNECCAKLKAAYPDRFRFCASLPYRTWKPRHREAALCARHARRGWNKTGNKMLQASTSATRHSTR